MGYGAGVASGFPVSAKHVPIIVVALLVLRPPCTAPHV